MKQTLLTLALMLLPMLASAVGFEIDGIYYNLNSGAKTAEVTSNPNKYSGSVVIPENVNLEGEEFSVTSIGRQAFDGCIGLTSITIPNSVTSIGERAFFMCSGLTSIKVESGNTKYDSRDNCNAIIETESNTMIAGCQNTIIPNSVTSIGGYAFYSCTGLTSINIPNSVTSIGDDAFAACSGLTSISIPNSVTSIGQYAFEYCSGLTSITIPNSVTSIEIWSFSFCSGLTSITIPNSVTSIGGSAFYGCIGLTSITIPNSVTSIENNAFSYCSGLTSINVESGNTKYDSRDDCNAIIETTSNTLIAGCQNTIIPNSVTSIGDGAFAYCSGLISITIPNGVASIGKEAFNGCIGLTSITIPNSVTSIGVKAFCFCPRLLDMFCFAENVPETGSEAFNRSNIANATLHVPAGSVDAYQAAEQWKDFKEIVALEDEGASLAKYDLNNDGVVDAADIIVLVNYIAGKK